MSDNLLPIVPHIWCHPKSIPAEFWHEVYGTCLRRAKGHCINSNLVKVIAKLMGRDVTFVSTHKGHLNWTERLSGGKFKFKAKLHPTYTAMIDNYDEKGQHFKMPVKCPFGKVVCKGPSQVSRQQNPLRTHKPKTKLRSRELQLPYVA